MKKFIRNIWAKHKLMLALVIILITCIVILYKMVMYTYITVRFKEARPFHHHAPVYYKGHKIGKIIHVRHSKDYQYTLAKLVIYPHDLNLPENISAKLKIIKRGRFEKDYVDLIYPQNPTPIRLKNKSVIEGTTTIDAHSYFSSLDTENLEAMEKNASDTIANLESSTLRGVSSLRNGETIAVASYGISADDGSFDLAVAGAEAGSFHAGEGADKAIDKNTSTMWHSEWAAGNNRDDLWITLDLGSVQNITGLRYLPRQSGGVNGIITEYSIEVSTDGINFTPYATGTWANDTTWKKAEFGTVEAQYVKLVAVDSVSGEIGNTYASAAEIALYYVPGDETEPDYREELETAILKGENKLRIIAENPETFWYVPDVTALEEKLEEAYILLDNAEATNEQFKTMADELNKATDVRYMSGDIDMDGKITIIDATVLQLYLNEENLGETDIAVIASDTDGSGEIDINDITEIQKYIVGIVEYLAPYEMIIS